MASDTMKAVKKIDNKTNQTEGKPNIFQRFTKYCKDVIAELKRVTWPSKKDLIGYTVAVIVFCVIFGVITGALDFVFGSLMRLIVG